MKIALDFSGGDFDERDRNRIRLLENDPLFEEKIRLARKACNILKPLINYPSGEILVNANKHAGEIVDLYGFTGQWVISISNFIVRGKFISPGSGIYLSGLAYQIDENGRKMPNVLTISVLQKTSFEDFKKWVSANKKSIDTHLNALPRKNPTFSKNFDQRLQIYGLSNKGYSPRQISEILLEEASVDNQDKVPTPPEISKIIYTFKIKLQKNSK